MLMRTIFLYEETRIRMIERITAMVSQNARIIDGIWRPGERVGQLKGQAP